MGSILARIARECVHLFTPLVDASEAHHFDNIQATRQHHVRAHGVYPACSSRL